MGALSSNSSSSSSVSLLFSLSSPVPTVQYVQLKFFELLWTRKTTIRQQQNDNSTTAQQRFEDEEKDSRSGKAEDKDGASEASPPLAVEPVRDCNPALRPSLSDLSNLDSSWSLNEDEEDGDSTRYPLAATKARMAKTMTDSGEARVMNARTAQTGSRQDDDGYTVTAKRETGHARPTPHLGKAAWPVSRLLTQRLARSSSSDSHLPAAAVTYTHNI
ncbi:hypothetical protein C8R42DRAFT_715013 [Lentinula raphanica]|nr:hypothetical protein C8R42DRAFT_715013 [Lentinula raphanica]